MQKIMVKLTDSDKKKARQIIKELNIPEVPGESILYGKGTVAGYLGKIAVARVLGIKLACCYDYDMILGGLFKISVKTKRVTTPKIEPGYECSVAAGATQQKCDWYAFFRIDRDTESVGWVVGFLPKEEYFSKSRFLTAGTVDGSNKKIIDVDCYNVKIGHLNPLPIPIKGGKKT